MDIVIISGLSGAGKSQTAAVMEDMGYYCVDNMPVEMIPKFVDLCLATRGIYERVALVTDVRSISDFDKFFGALAEIETSGGNYRILFVTASTDVIVKRYKETRRRHPLDPDGISLENAIERERLLMQPILNRADNVIDTSRLTLGQLNRTIYKMYFDNTEVKQLSLNFVSFGYKNGIPADADYVFDVRFLPNPYYISSLKDKTGLDHEVQDYIFSNAGAVEFVDKVTELLLFLVPRYIEEGRRNLLIAVGCTGGKHRSVAVAVKLTNAMVEQGYDAECFHRDSDKWTR